jgi:hypothetical protein
MVGGTVSMEGMAQCPGCHTYVRDEDLKCPDCATLLPRGQALRAQRGRELPGGQSAQREAYERYKQELTHVPEWLRRVVNAFRYASSHPLPHAIVQWGSGLLAFGMAFGASEALRELVPVGSKLRGMPFLGLQLILATAAFVLASRFVFVIFQKNIEIMLSVWGDEQDVRILRGQLEQKYNDSFKGR